MEYGSPGFRLAKPHLGKRLVEEAIADPVGEYFSFFFSNRAGDLDSIRTKDDLGGVVVGADEGVHGWVRSLPSCASL